MHFALTDEEEMIREAARRIAAERLAPLAERLDRGEGREELLANLKLLAENGFMALNVRSEYGGTEAGTVAFALAVEETRLRLRLDRRRDLGHQHGRRGHPGGRLGRAEARHTCRASPTAPIRPAPSA